MRLIDYLSQRTSGRLLAATMIAAVFGFGMVSTAGAINSITIFKSSLKTSEGRGEIRQFGGGNCKSGGSETAYRVKIGKATRECFYRVPVAGRDLEVSATARIFKSTPKSVRKNVFAAVALRHARDGSRYQLGVYPSARSFHLRKVLDSGKVIALDGGKLGSKKVNGFDEANRLTLRAYTGLPGQPSGSTRLVVIINGSRVSVKDDRGVLLKGQDTTFSIGSKEGANRALGSFSGIVMRIPDPFRG